jgi:hypothetical protein
MNEKAKAMGQFAHSSTNSHGHKKKVAGIFGIIHSEGGKEGNVWKTVEESLFFERCTFNYGATYVTLTFRFIDICQLSYRLACNYTELLS